MVHLERLLCFRRAGEKFQPAPTDFSGYGIKVHNTGTTQFGIAVKLENSFNAVADNIMLTYSGEGIGGFVHSYNEPWKKDAQGHITGNMNWITNWKIYNNTIYHIVNGGSGSKSGILSEAGLNNIVKNNLWYSCPAATGNTSLGITYDYNCITTPTKETITGPIR